MFGLGTIVNALAIMGGGGLGLLVRSRLKEAWQDQIMKVLGVITTFIGITGTLEGLLVVKDGAVQTQNIMMLMVCLIPGALIGELIDIDGAMVRLGDRIQSWMKKAGPSARQRKCDLETDLNTASQDPTMKAEGQGAAARQSEALPLKGDASSGGRFAEGFASSSILFCTGAMAILGSLNDGLRGDSTVLFAKSGLDCMAALIYAAMFGVGVLFSALSVGIYQGLLTALSVVIAPVLTDEIVASISLVGSAIIFCIGLNLSLKAKIRIGNLLPALIFAVIFSIYKIV